MLTLYYSIVRRRFYREFYEHQYPTYSFNKKILFLKEVEDFVDHNISFRILDKAWFGRDSDLEKTIRFLHLHILYQQHIFDEKLFFQWLDNPHLTTQSFKKQNKILGLIKVDNYYFSPWNNVMDEIQNMNKNQNNYVAGSYQEPEDIIECYLEHIFVEQKDKNIFKKAGKYLDQNALIHLKAKIQY